MGEKIVGLVLQVFSSVWRMKMCNLLLTDQRFILVERPPEPYTSIKEDAKDFLVHGRQQPNPYATTVLRTLNHEPNELERAMNTYERDGADSVASKEGSTSISYETVKKIKLHRGFGGNALLLWFMTPEGKEKKLDIRFGPSDDFLAKRLTIAPEIIQRVNSEKEYAHFTKEQRRDTTAQMTSAETDYLLMVRDLLVSRLPQNLVMNSEGLLGDSK